MRTGVAIAVILAATAPAVACPAYDLDDVASGGPIIAEIRRDDGPFKITTKAVPARPSLFFHRGTDETSPPPTFTDENGGPIAYWPVYTGIPEYPIRFDFAIESGTIIDASNERQRYEVSPSMDPHTRAVTIDQWNSYVRIVIESDAALLRFDDGRKTWFTASSPHMTLYFRSMDVRVTALYANRTDEVILEAQPPITSSTASLDRNDDLATFALLGLLGVLGLVACRVPIL